MNMKRLLIGIICLCFLPNNSYCQLKARVDERFELTSIVFALAGVPEYCQISIPSYKRDIIKELTPRAAPRRASVLRGSCPRRPLSEAGRWSSAAAAPCRPACRWGRCR